MSNMQDCIDSKNSNWLSSRHTGVALILGSIRWSWQWRGATTGDLVAQNGLFEKAVPYLTLFSLYLSHENVYTFRKYMLV